MANKMSDTTPYSTRPAGERAREQDCFRAILSTARPVSCVLEAFGGIGDTTAIVRETFPKAHIFATELDDATAAIHRERFTHDPLTGLVGPNALLEPWDRHCEGYHNHGVILDYNLCTLLRLRDPKSFVRKVLDAFAPALETASWVTITDAAIAKLHLNKASYGVTDLDDYVNAFALTIDDLLPGYVLAARANHSRALYLRFDRKV